MNSRHRLIHQFSVLLLFLSYFLLDADSRGLQPNQNSINPKYSGAIRSTARQWDSEKSFDEQQGNIQSPLQVSDLGSQRESHVAPRAEDAPTSEPEPSRKAEPEPTGVAENWPEPGPDWQKAFGTWGKAWHLHVYIFATVFLFVAIYAAYFVIHNARGGLQKKYLSITLNVVMFMFGSMRAFVLFFDPYHQGDLIDNWKAMHVLWSLGGPCLTSSDSLVILALLETTKITLAPPKLQKFKCIMTIILGHFFLVLLTDFVVSEFVDAKPMLVFCQSFFIFWGSLLGLGYFALAYKLDRKLFAHKAKDTNEKLYVSLIYASGVANFFLTAIFVYSSAGVFGVYSRVSHVDAWPWWTLQTFLRVSEVVSCVLVFTVSAKRKTVKSALKRAEQFERDEMTTEGYQVTTEIDADEDKSQPGHQDIHKASTARNQGRKVSIFSALLQSAKEKHVQVTPSPIDEDVESRRNTINQDNSEEHTMFSDLQKAKEEVFHLQDPNN